MKKKSPARMFGHGGWRGTADEFLTSTPEERVDATPEDVKAEIERRYGAKFPKRRP